ncbi:restriction endonuclease subunit S [Halochromatium roseum]|uniref:restriction endonuclease subunit S n=1 Tax=Halochromatium roseum TaxID=391920 RepID=UPI001F5E1EFE|nr:restriction endonuclease subunit S [Halochromatium roseum]
MINWQQTTVGEIATGFLNGGTPTTSRADFWKGEIPWITSKWLGEKLELTTGEKFVSEEAVKKTATKIVPKDSIIFATRVGVGKVGINRIDLAINQDLAGVLIDNENYDIKFLAYQLGIDSIQQYVAMNKRGATIKGITRDCLEQIRLNVPPLPEQKRIAHILSTVQRAIEAQQRIIQTTTELKKALMHKLFTEGLRNEARKETEIGPVPESWEVVELETLFEKQPQNGIYKHKRDYGSGTQILRIDDFSNDGDVVNRAGNLVALARDEIETYGLEPGDIVINRVNSLSHLGKTALIGAISGDMVFESNMMRFSVDESQVLKEYVFKFLSSPLTKKQIIGTAKRAVAQSSINQGDVKAIIVPKPTLEEQGEIVAALDATEAKISHSTDKAAVLQDLFRTLLHELMTAKIRVHELEFEMMNLE